MWKDFLYFSRSEKRGILLLILLVFIMLTIRCILPLYWVTDTQESLDDSENEYNAFISSLKEQEQHRKYSYKKYGDKKNMEIALSVFDPNTADSITFLRLGLAPWIAKNILGYRAKGGKFSTPEDFRKIYGLTEDQYAILLPYIVIDDKYQKKDTVRLLSKQEIPDSLKIFKYPRGVVVDLNRADTAELKKIPGIGSGIANKIVNYRKKLGGFYRIEQLSEINLDIDQLMSWFKIGEMEISRINLNKVSIERLKAHPYFNFYQAKVIIEYRKKKGKLKTLEQLSLYEEFTVEDLDKIGHYICFD